MDIFDKVKDLLIELCGVKDISLEHDLKSDLGLDSLQMVMLLMLLEEAFEIMLNETDMNPFELIYVTDIVTLVEKYLDGNHNDASQEEN